jgi:hypothetical protein
MKKKWLLMLTGIFLSVMMVVGCNVDQDQDPAPPEEDHQPERNPAPEEEQDPDPGGTPARELQEDIEEPFEDPDGDGVDENDPNPED